MGNKSIKLYTKTLALNIPELKYSASTLSILIHNEQTEAAKYLILSKQVAINDDELHEPPLYSAVFKNNLSLVELLLEHGALLSTCYKPRYDTLSLCVGKDYIDILEVILKNCANIKKANYRKAFQLAVELDKFKVVRMFMEMWPQKNNYFMKYAQSDAMFEYLSSQKYTTHHNDDIVKHYTLTGKDQLLKKYIKKY
jgi:ankyrin repeat protein